MAGSPRSRHWESGPPPTTASTPPVGRQLAGLAGAIAVLALLVGVAWWVRRRDLTIPVALAACALLYLASLPFSGDYSQAKALMIAAPLAMLVAIRPLLFEFPVGRPGGTRGATSMSASPSRPLGGMVRVGWGVLAVAFVAGAIYSSLLVLRDAPVGPAGHGSELQAFLPIVHGEPVLYAGQDRYAAYELLGADTHVPLVEFPDADVSPNPEKPFDTGDAYSPIDFDSFSHGTLERFDYVITGRAAWNSQAPAELQAGRRHPLLPALEADRAHRRRTATSCSRGPRPGRWRAAPRRRSASCSPAAGRASLFPGAVIGAKAAWAEGSVLGTGASDLAVAGAAGRRLEPLDPVLLPLRPDPLRAGLPRAADGGARRPAAEHDQPRQQRPVLARRALREQRRQGRLHAHRRRRRALCRASAATTARPTSASSSRSRPSRTGSSRWPPPATAGSTGTSHPRRPEIGVPKRSKKPLVVQKLHLVGDSDMACE